MKKLIITLLMVAGIAHAHEQKPTEDHCLVLHTMAQIQREKGKLVIQEYMNSRQTYEDAVRLTGRYAGSQIGIYTAMQAYIRLQCSIPYWNNNSEKGLQISKDDVKHNLCLYDGDC